MGKLYPVEHLAAFNLFFTLVIGEKDSFLKYHLQ